MKTGQSGSISRKLGGGVRQETPGNEIHKVAPKVQHGWQIERLGLIGGNNNDKTMVFTMQRHDDERFA